MSRIKYKPISCIYNIILSSGLSGSWSPWHRRLTYGSSCNIDWSCTLYISCFNIDWSLWLDISVTLFSWCLFFISFDGVLNGLIILRSYLLYFLFFVDIFDDCLILLDKSVVIDRQLFILDSCDFDMWFQLFNFSLQSIILLNFSSCWCSVSFTFLL